MDSHSSGNQSGIIMNHNLLVNETSGEIRFFDIGRWAINNKDSLENYGLIHIDSSHLENVVNEGIVHNTGRMIFKNQSPVNNKSSVLNSAGNQGFTNSGLLKFNEPANGIEFNLDTFTNTITGEIIVEGANNVGITSSNAAGYFVNEGRIETRDCHDGIYVIGGTLVNTSSGSIVSESEERYGMGAVSGASITNHGEVIIRNAGDIGIVTSISSSEFITTGTVMVLSPVNAAIENGVNCLFRNHDCGILQAKGSIINNGSFINEAYMTSGANIMNNDIFTNAGVIGSTKPDVLSHITSNSGSVFFGPAAIDQVGETFSTLFHGSGSGITVPSNNLRLTADPSSPIGVSFSNPQWEVECAAVGKAVFFLDIQVGSCPVMAMEALFTQINPVSISVNTWTGTVNSDWHNSANWSTNSVPDGCDSVVIVNGAQVIISSQATAYAVALSQGAVLTNNGSLFIGGESALNLSLDNARLENNGEITMELLQGDGIVLNNGGRFLNNALAVCTINNRNPPSSFKSLQTSAGDTVINMGVWSFSDLTEAPAELLNEGYLQNQNQGTMVIDGIFENRLSSAVIDNAGLLEIEDFDHDQDAYLINQECGKLTFHDITWRDSADNYGIMRFAEKIRPSTNILFDNVIRNYGIIEDYKEKNTVPGKILLNEGVVFSQRSEQLAVGFSQPMSFTTGNFTFSNNFYADPALCIPIGTYDDASKIITPNQYAGGVQLICFEIEKTGSGCLDTFCVELEIPIRRETCASGSLDQLNALLVFYDSLNGPGWINRIGWQDGKAGTDCDICNWNGVVCDPTNSYVTGIILGGNNLSGKIPASLAQLDSLKVLDLRTNSITGGVPSFFDQMPQLEELNLDNNTVAGSLPTNLGMVSALQKLSLNNCGLSGTVPSSLENLVNLIEMDLGGNSLSNDLPDLFHSMPSLEFISFRNNQVGGMLPSSIGDLDNLTTLDLLNNNFEGCFPASWSNLCDNGLTAQLAGNNLPGDGDFNAFCSSNFGICQDPNNCILPGDTLRFVPSNSLLSWHTHVHWDLGRAPDHCDHVILEPDKWVIIPTGKSGNCRTIEIQLGANLAVDGTFNATVSPPP